MRLSYWGIKDRLYVNYNRKVEVIPHKNKPVFFNTHREAEQLLSYFGKGQTLPSEKDRFLAKLMDDAPDFVEDRNVFLGGRGLIESPQNNRSSCLQPVLSQIRHGLQTQKDLVLYVGLTVHIHVTCSYLYYLTL